MFENPRRGRQARNFTTNVPKILDLKSSSEQIFFRKLSLGAPAISPVTVCCFFRFRLFFISVFTVCQIENAVQFHCSNMYQTDRFFS